MHYIQGNISGGQVKMASGLEDVFKGNLDFFVLCWSPKGERKSMF